MRERERALVAWRGGLFLTEGKIVVLSVSSLFLTRVGVYVCVSVCIRMQNYRKYKNDSQNYQLRGISLVAKKTVALLLPDLESDIQSDYFEIDDLRIFRKNFPEKHIGTKWRKTGLPAKDDPGIILSESLVKFIQDKNYPASFMLEEDKIEFFGIDCVTKSSYLLVHQKLNVYYKPNGNPIGKTLGKFIQKPSGDEYLFDNVENKKRILKLLEDQPTVESAAEQI